MLFPHRYLAPKTLPSASALFVKCGKPQVPNKGGQKLEEAMEAQEAQLRQRSVDGV